MNEPEQEPRINVGIRKSLHHRLKIRVAKDGVKVNEFVEEAIKRALSAANQSATEAAKSA